MTAASPSPVMSGMPMPSASASPSMRGVPSATAGSAAPSGPSPVLNGARSTLLGGDAAFRVALGGHTMTVTHTDGYPVAPVRADALLIGMGNGTTFRSPSPTACSR